MVKNRWVRYGVLGVLSLFLYACGGSGGSPPSTPVFDDTSLQGVWLSMSGSTELDHFFETDGNGNVTDYSFFNFPPSGVYSVASDGAFSMTIHNGQPDAFTLNGQLETASAGTLVGPVGNVPINKVTNVAALEGTLVGTVTETCAANGTLLCDGTVYDVLFSVDTTGGILGSLTDGVDTFTVTAGRVYEANNNIVMLLFTTGGPGGDLLAYDLMLLKGTRSVANISGVYRPDYGGELPIGVWDLTYAPNHTHLLQGDYTFANLNGDTGSNVLTAETGTLSFDGIGTVTVIFNGTTDLPYTITTGNRLGFGSFSGQVKGDGEFFVATDTLDDGDLQLLVAAKKTTGATDALLSGDYITGLMAHNSTLSVTTTQAFSAVATPGAPSQIAYSEIAPGGSTPIRDYTVAADGSLSIAANDEFGQVAPSGQIFISVDDDSVNPDTVQFTSMGLALPGVGMSNASLSGAYALHRFADDGAGTPLFVSNEYDLVFDGNGALTFAEVAGSVPCAPDCSGAGSYVVNTDGTWVLDPAGDADLGTTLADGSVIMLIGTNPPGIPKVMVGVKKP